MSLSVTTGELVNEDDSDHGVCVCVFSVLKKNKLRLSVGKRVQLEIITLSKLSQTQKIKYCEFFLICGS